MDPAPTFRVFVVEDEPLIAMVVEDSIELLGYEVIGPFAQHDEALAIATAGGFDCAILDVNIRGGNSYDVADVLLSRGCPFVMATGYSDWSIPPHLIGAKRLTLLPAHCRVPGVAEPAENAITPNRALVALRIALVIELSAPSPRGA